MQERVAGQNVLVTGASGFIGQVLVRRLIDLGAVVRTLDRTGGGAHVGRAHVFVGDVRDADVVRRAVEGVDTVFHLAGKAHDVREAPFNHEQYDVSVGGAASFAALPRASLPKRLVFLSSLSVYGHFDRSERTEDGPCEPTSAYGGGKLLAERVLLAWGRSQEIQVACLRPALVYGPGSKGNLDRLLRLCARGVLPDLPESSVGRVMVHVDDVAEACLYAAFTPRAAGRSFNVTDGEQYTAAAIVEAARKELGMRSRGRLPMPALRAFAKGGDLLEKSTGRRMPLSSSTLEKLFGPALVSNARLRELGWSPAHTLWTTLPEMVTALQAT